MSIATKNSSRNIRIRIDEQARKVKNALDIAISDQNLQLVRNLEGIAFSLLCLNMAAKGMSKISNQKYSVGILQKDLEESLNLLERTDLSAI